MDEAARLRDSTQITLPSGTLGCLREEVEARFTVTVRNEQAGIRIIGSPVEIKDVSGFLARHGVAVA